MQTVPTSAPFNIYSRSFSLKNPLLQLTVDVQVLAYHYQGVHGQRSLTCGQHNDGIQVHFVETVSEIISQPREPGSHFGERVDVGRRGAAYAGEYFCAFEI